MAYPTTEIFDEYVKLAEEAGLISEADYAEERKGSDTKEVIEMLYGVKPNGDEDDKHIMEKAHPDTAVVIPTYDRMNAIVENELERQNVTYYAAMKDPQGNHTGHRYVSAYNDLMDTLVSTGFYLDSKNEDELTKFTDECTEQLSKKAAISPALIGTLGKVLPWVLRAGAVFLGYTGIVNRGLDVAGISPTQGILNDVENASKELREAASKSYPGVQTEITIILKALDDFRKLATQYLSLRPIDVDIDKATVADLIKLRQSPESMDKMRLARAYLAAMQTLKASLPALVDRLKNAGEKEETWGSFWQPVSEVVRFFSPSDLEDAYMALNTLVRSLDNEEKSVMYAMNNGQEHAAELAIRMRDIVQRAMSNEAMPEEAKGGMLTRLVQEASALNDTAKKLIHG